MIKRMHITVTRKSAPTEYGITDGVYYGDGELCYGVTGRSFYYTDAGTVWRPLGEVVKIPLDDIAACAVEMDDYLEYDTIKEAREAVGLSRAELAHKLGIPKRTIENWDSGKSSPPEWVKRLLIEKIATF